MSSLDSESRAPKVETLTEGEKALLDKLFGNWLVIPDSFKASLADYVSQNSNIPISQVRGFTESVEFVGAKAKRTSDQTFTSTLTVVTFQATEFDTSDYWDAGSPTKLTIPPGKGGGYIVVANIGGTSSFYHSIMKNGVDLGGGAFSFSEAVFGNASGTALFQMDDGDYIIVANSYPPGSTGASPTLALMRTTGPLPS